MAHRVAPSLGVAAIAALALLPACAFGPSVPVLLGDADVGGVRLQIEAAWRDHIAAAQRRDLEGVMAIYTDDCVYEALGTPAVNGKQALRAMEQRGLEQGQVVSAAHRIESLRVSGALAWVSRGTRECYFVPWFFMPWVSACVAGDALGGVVAAPAGECAPDCSTGFCSGGVGAAAAAYGPGSVHGGVLTAGGLVSRWAALAVLW